MYNLLPYRVIHTLYRGRIRLADIETSWLCLTAPDICAFGASNEGVRRARLGYVLAK